jgi:hypothetical protein
VTPEGLRLARRVVRLVRGILTAIEDYVDARERRQADEDPVQVDLDAAGGSVAADRQN